MKLVLCKNSAVHCGSHDNHNSDQRTDFLGQPSGDVKIHSNLTGFKGVLTLGHASQKRVQILAESYLVCLLLFLHNTKLFIFCQMR